MPCSIGQAGPNSEANGYFSYQALEHYRPAVLHWLTVACGLDGRPNPDLYLQPTPMALQNWAIGYATATPPATPPAAPSAPSTAGPRPPRPTAVPA
ncbi:hypothetical protein ABZY81_41490 [Streptomyces sp. NPDC006514]|uniref:hypothetical protein n=1 Tax=Streptomyces sp. NPDC006514 TaxID=3154308 RepID=UPI0033A9D1EC